MRVGKGIAPPVCAMEGQTNEKEESNVTKKAKKTSKLRDLKPTKDAKGGRGRCSDYLNRRVQ